MRVGVIYKVGRFEIVTIELLGPQVVCAPYLRGLVPLVRSELQTQEGIIVFWLQMKLKVSSVYKLPVAGELRNTDIHRVKVLHNIITNDLDNAWIPPAITVGPREKFADERLRTNFISKLVEAYELAVKS